MSSVVDVLASMRKRKSTTRLTTLNDPDLLCRVDEWVPTGCPPLDVIMGGGVPVGRIIEISGDTSTGKSLVGGHIIANAQAVGAATYLIDSEAASSLEVMHNLGVDMESCGYAAPDTLEEVWRVIEDLVYAQVELDDSLDDDEEVPPLVVVWDSVAGVTTETEYSDDISKMTPALHARLMSKGLRRHRTDFAECGISFVCLNQVRENIGKTWGDGLVTFGGKALGFYSTIRVRLRIRTKVKERGEIVGVQAEAFVIKNKIAAPFRRARLYLTFGYGIDVPTTVLEYLKDVGVVTAKGSWYTIHIGDDMRKFQRSMWYNIYADHTEYIDGLVYSTVLYDDDDAEDIDD